MRVARRDPGTSVPSGPSRGPQQPGARKSRRPPDSHLIPDRKGVARWTSRTRPFPPSSPWSGTDPTPACRSSRRDAPPATPTTPCASSPIAHPAALRRPGRVDPRRPEPPLVPAPLHRLRARAAAGAVPRQRLGRPPRVRPPRAHGRRAQLPRGLCLYLSALRWAGPPPPEDLRASLLRLLEVLGRGGERRGVLPALRRARRRRGAGRGPVWSLPGAGRGGHRQCRVARPARAAALPPSPLATEVRRRTGGARIPAVLRHRSWGCDSRVAGK